MVAQDPRTHQFASLRALIGDTPAAVLRLKVDGITMQVVAKVESLNFTGSIKDRMVYAILHEAWSVGQLDPGTELVEVTSGNTGVALAAIGRALDLKVRIYMPDWMSAERRQLIASLGAEIVSVSRAEGGFRGSIDLADEYCRERSRALRLDQFSDRAGVAAHRETTGKELAHQLLQAGLLPDAFVAGVGTGGTVMGVGAALRSVFPNVSIHPLEPASSPTLRTGHKVGEHRIQGISDEFVPALVDLSGLDAIVDADDGDAIHMAQRLAAENGMGVGISSGANLVGAIRLGMEIGDGAVIATVFPDSNKKYLSTALFRSEALRPDHLSCRVQLLGVHVVPRVGGAISDPTVAP